MLLLEKVLITCKETGETRPRLLEAFTTARNREGEAQKREQEENVPSREVAWVGHDTRNQQADGSLDVSAEGVGEAGQW